ncbi:hypothetical protein P692DRAFT_20269884 [Suillus brevipes Sb2]|nr:hypothetical protein P692DRAFT_20269884 [Suillus brevipes Sb2]
MKVLPVCTPAYQKSGSVGKVWASAISGRGSQDQKFNQSWLTNSLQTRLLSHTSLTRHRFCCQTTKTVCICTCYAVSGLALLLLCCRIKLRIVEVY